MPRYQVRPGVVLPHEGEVLEAGAYVELRRHVAEDVNIRGLVQEVDPAGKPVAAPVVEQSIAHFQRHERIGMLQERLVEARARVTALETQLAEEESPMESASALAAPVSKLTQAASRGVKE